MVFLVGDPHIHHCGSLQKSLYIYIHIYIHKFLCCASCCHVVKTETKQINKEYDTQSDSVGLFDSMPEDTTVHQFKQQLKELQPDVISRKLTHPEVVLRHTRVTDDDDEKTLLEVLNFEGAPAEVGPKRRNSLEAICVVCVL